MKRLLTTILIVFVLSISAVSCYSDEASEWYYKGVEYCNQGLYGKCIECLNKSIKLKPNVSDGYFVRGQAYYMTARYEEAIYDFTKTIKYYPSFSPGYFWRGRSYNEIKNSKKAISDFTKAIELDPENAEYYAHRGMVYDNNKKIYGLDEAERDYRKACELGNSFACDLLRSLY